MYDNAGFDNAQNRKLATRSGERETVGNKETKSNKKTTDSDKVDFAGFNGRFTRVIFVFREKNLGI